MMFESLESRQLFAVTLPVSKYVLPLTKANSHATPPAITVNAKALTNALPHLTDALKHFKTR